MDNSFQQRLEPAKTKPPKGYLMSKSFSFILTVTIGVVLMMMLKVFDIFDGGGPNFNNMLAISTLVGLLFIVTTWKYTFPLSEALFGGGGAGLITVTLSLFLAIAQIFVASTDHSSDSIESFILLAALVGNFVILYGFMCMIVSAIASLLSFFLKKAIFVYIHWTFNYKK